MIDGFLLMMGVVAVTGLAAWLFLSAEDDEPKPAPYVYFFDDGIEASSGSQRPAPLEKRTRGQ